MTIEEYNAQRDEARDNVYKRVIYDEIRRTFPDLNPVRVAELTLDIIEKANVRFVALQRIAAAIEDDEALEEDEYYDEDDES